MKKKKFILLFTLVAITMTAQAQVVLNEGNFPDANFRAALTEELGIGEGEEITVEMITMTTWMDISNRLIADLTGIKHFTSLTMLDCANNQLTTLDLSKNTALKQLRCYSNLIDESSMEVLVNSLPRTETARLFVIDTADENEKNVCTKAQVDNALKKGWSVYDINGENEQKYEGSEPSHGLILNSQYFPDANFRAALASKLRISDGYAITDNMIQITTSLEIWGKSIVDLTGIEHFTALEKLDCQDNQLTSFDISKNTALKFLNCSKNQLTSLDVSSNIALKELNCSNNQLSTLNLSQNTLLSKITCERNKIKGESMDLLMESLPVVENGFICVTHSLCITNWNNGNYIVKYYLNEKNVCTTNHVAVAQEKGWAVKDFNDMSGYTDKTGISPDIKSIIFNADNFPDYNFRLALGDKFETLFEIREGEELTENVISFISDINVNNCFIFDLTGIEHFPNLRKINCDDNPIASLDVSKNTKIKSLSCNNNQLTRLNLSKNIELTELNCMGNQLTTLDISANTQLKELNCAENKLTELEVSKNVMLQMLNCSDNQLTSLTLLKNVMLTELLCNNNRLVSFELSKYLNLKVLNCSYNQLAVLDVSKSLDLEFLACSNNQITEIDITKNSELMELHCDNNQLISLDVSKNTELTSLWCYCNQIKGEAMDALVANLLTVEWGEFIVINTKDENERNVCTKSQVAVAKEKGWTVCNYNGGVYDENYDYGFPEYEGSDDGIFLDEENFGDENFREILSEILNVNEGDNITEKIIENLKMLNVSDKSIANLSGIEYFTSMTTLYCHINQIKNEEMTALIAALPDLSSNEAKSVMCAEETNPRAGALYVLDFTDENEQNVCTAEHVTSANAKGWTVYCKTANGWQEYNGEIPTEIGASLNDNGQMINDCWYSIDGVKLNGEPTRKGIHIRNGKKVVKS